ncbi:MAG: HEAT repeat domain-containing protein [Pirellulaceae bacterium]
MVDDRNGLLTLAVYVTAALVIVLAAVIGVFRYAAVARVAALQPIVSEPAPEIAVAYRDRVPRLEASGTAASDVEQQRIHLLEALLEEKSQRLRQQSEQLQATTSEYEELRARYDEAVLLAVNSSGNNPVTPGNNPAAKVAADTPAGTATPDMPTAPALLEAELTAAGVVHESLVADLAALQEELARVHTDMEQLKETRDQETTERLRDAVLLETAAANVLVRAGRDSVPALREALDHSSPAVRRWAALVLGGIGSEAEDAVPALTEALSDRDRSVRDAARTALEAIER